MGFGVWGIGFRVPIVALRPKHILHGHMEDLGHKVLAIYVYIYMYIYICMDLGAQAYNYEVHGPLGVLGLGTQVPSSSARRCKAGPR